MPRKFCAVSARICVSPDAAAGSSPAMTSGRPPLSRNTIASTRSASKPLPSTASSTSGRNGVGPPRGREHAARAPRVERVARDRRSRAPRARPRPSRRTRARPPPAAASRGTSAVAASSPPHDLTAAGRGSRRGRRGSRLRRDACGERPGGRGRSAGDEEARRWANACTLRAAEPHRLTRPFVQRSNAGAARPRSPSRQGLSHRVPRPALGHRRGRAPASRRRRPLPAGRRDRRRRGDRLGRARAPVGAAVGPDGRRRALPRRSRGRDPHLGQRSRAARRGPALVAHRRPGRLDRGGQHGVHLDRDARPARIGGGFDEYAAAAQGGAPRRGSRSRTHHWTLRACPGRCGRRTST